MNDQITVGAAMLLGSITVGFLALRWYVRPEPAGRHRAGRSLLRPVEALVEVTVHCRAEGRDTRHARTRVTGDLVCRSCGHLNTATTTATTTATVKGD